MPGTVYLVGAGPGDPGLITRRALDLIAEADVILYDRLIPAGALDNARPDADLRYVGKRPGEPAVGQDEISRTLIELARAGRSVVRLKGGDPFVFGRGGEEAQALAEAGIPFEVVPGVTAGVAAPAYAGIPLTHRGLSAQVTVVTARGANGDPLDYPSLVAVGGTLLVFMGLEALGPVTEGLLAHGADPSLPAAVVSRGTCEDQEVARAPLAEIAEAAAGLRTPALLVVGAVVDLSALLASEALGELVAVG